MNCVSIPGPSATDILIAKVSQKMMDSSKLRLRINWGHSMLRNLFFVLTLVVAGLSSVVQAENALPAGPSAFVLIARLHAFLAKLIKW